jgi:4-amino-4-deoxy-L-arabinose transferase-like glycosyltransferase
MSDPPTPGPLAASPAAEWTRRFPGRAPWIAILAVALLARLAFVAVLPPVIASVDGRYYVEIAHRLVEQHTFGPRVQRGPGYSLFIAGVFWVFGPNLVVLRIVESALGTVSVGLIGVIGARLFGRTAGLISALLAALHPVLAFLPSTQYSENLLALATTVALGSAFAALRRGGLWRWSGCGALLGLVLLIRPSSVFLLPGLAAGLALVLRRESRAWVAPALVCGAAIALTLAPWIARNHRVYGQWFFIASGGGRAFWFGNNPKATADTRVPAVLEPAMEEEMRSLPDELARERHLFRRALAWVRQNPGRAAWLYVLELRNLFALYPDPATRAHADPWGRAVQGLASAVVFAGALLSLGRLRADPPLWVLAALAVSYALGCAFFFTAMRYRIAIEPALLWMSGSGWAGSLAARGPRASPPSPASCGSAGRRR